MLKKNNIKPPTIIVIGDVVELTKKLTWFEKRPLNGKKILVTRSRHQASQLSELLREKGAELLEIPTIEFKAPTRWAPLDRAIRSISGYHWIIFSSVNGVRFFFERLRSRGRDSRDLLGVKVAAIGLETAKSIDQQGISVDLVAKKSSSEGLLKAFRRVDLEEKRILIPRAKEGSEVVSQGLTERGALVDLIESYRTVGTKPLGKGFEEMIQGKKIDLVVFASSSSVENFLKKFKRKKEREWATQIPVASIGPMTSQTAKKMGFQVVIESKKQTISFLTDSIVRYYSSGKK